MMPHPTEQWAQIVRRYSVCTSGLGKFLFSSTVAFRTHDRGNSPSRAPLPSATPPRIKKVRRSISLGDAGSVDIRCSHSLSNCFMEIHLPSHGLGLLQPRRLVVLLDVLREPITLAGLLRLSLGFFCIGRGR